ncbi:MAG: hypothetical protein BWX66_01401 [Deltaproteobacteria bacterium ADurb.Bin058]|nr:MAG: hypothetical protein BWX66_01401 [Deltaproteobacteria bacterium ADurb.Bin058]
MPPNQCISALQMFNDTGKASTELKMLAPVVVKPEALSKNASKNEGTYPEIISGNAPRMHAKIQEPATTTKPAFMEKTGLLFCLKMKAKIPGIKNATIGNKKAKTVSVSR